MVQRIRELCKQRGMTIASLERVCGFSNGSISKWDKHVPSKYKIQAVADALGTTVQFLVDGETGIKKQPSIPKDEELNKNDAVWDLREAVLERFPAASSQEISALLNAVEGNSSDLTIQEIIAVAEILKRMTPADKKFLEGIFEAYSQVK